MRSIVPIVSEPNTLATQKEKTARFGHAAVGEFLLMVLIICAEFEIFGKATAAIYFLFVNKFKRLRNKLRNSRNKVKATKPSGLMLMLKGDYSNRIFEILCRSASLASSRL